MRAEEFITEGGTAGRWIPNNPLPAGWLQAWRGDTRTGTIETLPYRYNPSYMTKQLSAYKWARDRKLLPTIPPEIWAALAMVEGREDFGYNGVQTTTSTGPSSGIPGDPRPGDPGYKGFNTSPSLEKFVDKVKEAGMADQDNAVWIAFLHDKIKTAQRLGVTFYRAWNGSGVFQSRFNAQITALEHPKNKPFLDWFKQQLA